MKPIRALLALTTLVFVSLTPHAAHAQNRPAPGTIPASTAMPTPGQATNAQAANFTRSAPLSPTYVANPGDTLDLSFRWTPEFNQTVTIQPDGGANVTAAGGEIHLAGLTLPEIHDAVLAQASARLLNPELIVIPHDIDRAHILISGEVTYPGRIDLRQATTAFEAVFLAGGAKESSAMSHVIVFRPMNAEYSQVYRLNFSGYDSGHKPHNDMLLQPGDMVLVPRDGLTKIGRYVKSLNLGAYFNFNPFGTNGLF